MQLSKLTDQIEAFAPKSLAESWDNVGLLFGDRNQDVVRAVLCLDVSQQAYQMCVEKNAQVCISHHPFLFEPMKRMDFQDPYDSLLRGFIRSDVAVYAAHTNLDACVGGVNDALAKTLGLEVKETFLPAGEPFDVSDSVVPGTGRIGVFHRETGLFELYATVLHTLQTSGCHINFDADRPVRRILVIGGSYDSQWNRDVLDNDVDVVISGEIKHRDLIFFSRHGVAAIAAGHDATERVVLGEIAARWNREIEGVEFLVCPSLLNKPILAGSGRPL